MQPLLAAPRSAASFRRRPGTFDWVLEPRASRVVPSTRRKSGEPPVHARPPEPAFESLLRAGHRLGARFDGSRLLELAPPKPLLAAALQPEAARSLTVLLGSGEAPMAANWSSRFLHTRFFVGPPAFLARIAPGGFDWIIDWNRGDARDHDREPTCLARLLAAGGLLATREPLDRAQTRRPHQRGDLDRARLTPLLRETLLDGTAWLFARRR